MSKLLITGGSGFLGYHICNKLKNKFDKLIIVDINELDSKEYPKNIKFYKEDVVKYNKIDEIIKNEKPDFIIHAAAGLPLYKKEHIKKINIVGTKNILESALKNKVKRVCFISSTAVYGVPKRHPIYEKDPLSGVGTYGETKIIAEKICEDYRKKGLCVPVIRPKTFIGTGRLGVFQILYDWVENGKKIPVIGNGKNKYQLLEVEDLVDSIYLTLIKEKDISNQTFNVGAEKFNTVYEDVSALCKHAKKGSRVQKTPAETVKIILRAFEFFGFSPLYKWVYETADKDSFVSIEKIKNELGWKPKYSNAEALIRSYDWYIKNKHTLGGTGITHRVAWKQGALGIVKKFIKIIF
jgi:nucleoside-diphosphate-sugar epimerase